MNLVLEIRPLPGENQGKFCRMDGLVRKGLAFVDEDSIFVETPLKGAMAKVFISYATECPFSETITELVHSGLPDGYVPFLDRKDILKGTDWKARIQAELAVMDVIIFLYSTEALVSDWVRHESTVAEIRKNNGEELVVMTVLLDKVGPNDLKSGFFRPLDVDKLQHFKWGGEALKDLPSCCIEIITGVQAVAPVELYAYQNDAWNVRIADHLKNAKEGALKQCANKLALKLPDNKICTKHARLRIAEELRQVDVKDAQIREALNSLKGALDSQATYDLLIDEITPLWVDRLAAKEVADTMEKPDGEKTIAINCKEVEYAKHYVATGLGSLHAATCYPCDVPFETPSIIESFERLLEEKFHSNDLSKIKKRIQDSTRKIVFCVPPKHIYNEDLVNTLNQKYGEATTLLISEVGCEQLPKHQACEVKMAAPIITVDQIGFADDFVYQIGQLKM